MAIDLGYGKQNWPKGFRMFSGEFLKSMSDRVFQGGLQREDTITAKAGGGQATAYQLKRSLNRVATVATTADSVAAPKAIAGSMVYVTNAGANSLNLFAKNGSGDTINGASTSTAYAIAAGKTALLICNTSGQFTAVTFP